MQPESQNSKSPLVRDQSLIETNRKEAEEVKKFFTAHAHQAMIASAAIMGLSIQFLKADDISAIGWFVSAVAFILISILCITTANVGCHKYSTYNRITAYQIHLSRVIDYDQNHRNAGKVAGELLKIDWEEAMFAWRIVQPVIFDYFYKQNKLIGMCFKRFKYDTIAGKSGFDKIVRESIKHYPWYDSKELLKGGGFKDIFKNISDEKKKKSIINHATFFPGTYLRKILCQLYIFAMPCSLLAMYSLYNIQQYKIIFWVLIILLGYYTVVNILNTWWRRAILESGLLSIQTSGFVWRIVCLSHLSAKLNAIEQNKSSFNGSNPQIYNGYTYQLARVACEDLYYNLHKIHDWLARKEAEIDAKLS